MPPGAPVLAALRSATQGRHHTLEQVVRLDGDFTLDHYLRVLRGFAAFLPAWQQQVLTALPEAWRPWFSRRQRLPMLHADLACLGQAVPPPAALADLALSTPVAALGSMYVLEGSSLGGQLIARQLAQRHGIGADTGGAYFHGFGEATGDLWREFRLRLEHEAGDPPWARAQACTAALRTFDALIAHFQVALHGRAAG